MKEALRQAFAALTDDDDDPTPDSVHGEFGTAEAWTGDRSAQVRAWLADPANAPQLLDAIDALTVQTEWTGDATFRGEQLAYLRGDLIREITAIAGDPRYTQPALSERLAGGGLLPMFGFPTRVRLLHTRWPGQAHPWPPAGSTIDRDLDIAIAQFAPGSETVRDAAVHTACGVFAPYPVGGIVKFDNGFAPPLPDDNPAPVCRCSNCDAALRRTGDAPLAPGPALHPPVACPICGQLTLTPVDAREPRGFVTDLTPEDYTGSFEWQPRSSRPAIDATHQPDMVAVPGTNAVVGQLGDKPEHEILSVNDRGGEGFEFRRLEHRNANQAFQPVPGAFGVLEKDGIRLRPAGETYRVALLSRRRTDVLLADVADWPAGVYADPSRGDGGSGVTSRAAWYSLAFALRAAAAELLDVDTLELDASFRTCSRDGKPAGQAFLSDKLENGAGYCRYLAAGENFARLLRQFDPGTPGGLASRWLEPAHAEECDASCNRCLRDFGNMPYHGLLDWRLALDMARLMRGGTSPDLVTPWETCANPWGRVTRCLPQTLAQLGYGEAVAGTLRAFVLLHKLQPKRQVLIERHPLWTDSHPTYAAAVSAARSTHGAATNRRLIVWTMGTPRSFTAPQLTRLEVSNHNEQKDIGDIVLASVGGDHDAQVGLFGLEQPHEIESLIREVLIDKTFERLGEGRSLAPSRAQPERGPGGKQTQEVWSAAADAVADRQEFDPASAKKRTQKELDAAGLPDEWQARIEDELTPSEAVLWAGKASAAAMGSAAWVATWVMIGASAFLAAIIVGIGIADPKMVGGLTVAIGLAVVGAVVVGAFLYPPYQRWLAGKTCYAVTTRKALVWYPSWYGTPELTIYEPAALASIHTVESNWSKGFGDVVFRKTVTVTITHKKHGPADRSTSVTHYGFLAVEKPREIERLIRRQLVDPMIDAAAED